MCKMGRGRKPKYVNEGFFDEESETMHYVLGVSFGLATISDKRLIFRSKNKELIEIIKRELESQHKIVNIESRNSHQLEIYGKGSAYLITSLKARGLAEDKSERIFPKNIAESYLSHFDRGFFDSRGVIINTNKKINIGFYFNNAFLTDLNNGLRENAGVKKTNPENNKIVYPFNDSLRMYNFIYRDWDFIESKGLYLKRKKERFNIEKEEDVFDTDRIKIELLDGKTVEELTKELGYSSTQSFYSAFKRVYGETVGRFLKNELGHDNRLYNGMNLG